jgi:hypothetical protein
MPGVVLTGCRRISVAAGAGKTCAAYSKIMVMAAVAGVGESITDSMVANSNCRAGAEWGIMTADADVG